MKDTCRVHLHFAGIFSVSASVGARLFDVDIEGINVPNNDDIVADMGFPNAVVKAFWIASTDGWIDVNFRHVVENPKTLAIEVLSPDAAVPISPGSAIVGVDYSLHQVLVATTGPAAPGT